MRLYSLGKKELWQFVLMGTYSHTASLYVKKQGLEGFCAGESGAGSSRRIFPGIPWFRVPSAWPRWLFWVLEVCGLPESGTL